MATILTAKQQQALQLIVFTPLAKQFYFSGGTALSHYYLQHRKSEDLDFFSQPEFDPQDVTITLKSLQAKLQFTSFDFQSSFNRNLYFLKFNDGYILKLEFTYYPFEQIEKPVFKDGLLVDSVIDIATNKVFTITQQPRGRDYFDLFWIVKKYSFKLEDLRMAAKQKFDWHIDPLQLASRLNEVTQHLDDPIIKGEGNNSELVVFFEEQASDLSDQIIST